MSYKKRASNPLIVLLFLILGFYLGRYLTPPNSNIRLIESSSGSKFTELLQYLSYNYVDPIDIDSLQEDLITKTIESLDPHSSYIPVDEMQGITESMQGNFEGIGVEFQILNDTIVVVSPISGGPSQKKGIKAGDKIIMADSINIAGVGFTNKDVLKTLKGPKGTSVNLTIKRSNMHQLIEVDIIRDKIPITSVDVHYMIENNIGYIKVNRFSGTTDQEFIQAMNNLKDKGMKKLILDLRSNPGGYLSAAINMVDEFLPSGKTIVYTQGNSRNKQIYTSSYFGGFTKEKLVVLIDEGSASASEIIAGAIQDHDRGSIIGRRTFGKGLVQEQIQLSDGSAFRLTTSRYFTPSGRSIQKPYTDDSEIYFKESQDRYYNGELYHEDSIKIQDSLKFYTSEGKVVYGGGGIFPDYFIPLDTVGRSNWLYELIAKNALNSFSFQYVDQHRKELISYKSAKDFQNKFKIGPKLFRKFTQKCEDLNIIGNSQEIKNSKMWIQTRLKALIGKQLFSDEGFYRAVNEDDKMIKKALEIL